MDNDVFWDDFYMDPMDEFAYGDGLNASIFYDYLLNEHQIDSECFLNDIGQNGGSVVAGMVVFGNMNDCSYNPENYDLPMNYEYSVCFYHELRRNYAAITVKGMGLTKSHTLYIGRCRNGIGRARMDQIFKFLDELQFRIFEDVDI